MDNQTSLTGSCHARFDTHHAYAATNLSTDSGHLLYVNQSNLAAVNLSADQCAHSADDTQLSNSPLIGNLTEMHRQRVDLHRAEKSLTLQIKAKCRRLCGGDKTEADKVYRSMMNGMGHELAPSAAAVSAPFIQARSLIAEQRSDCEKQMKKMAKELPVWAWVKDIRGFGELSLAGIIGETGDLNNYSTPSKLWKRLGLAVINGGRQRKVAGVEALEHGYAPHRRSLVWNLGDTMIKGVIRKVNDDDGEDTGERVSLNEYGAIYLARKAYESERVETKAHAHNRAKRYMEKRLILDLWKAWRL